MYVCIEKFTAAFPCWMQCWTRAAVFVSLAVVSGHCCLEPNVVKRLDVGVQVCWSTVHILGLICPISVRWNRSTLPCACELYVGDCLTVMLPPILLAAVCRSAIRWSSWSDCSIVLLSTACTLPHSMRNDWMQLTWYWKSCCLSPTIVAITMPVSTSIPVRIAVVVASPAVLK